MQDEQTASKRRQTDFAGRSNEYWIWGTSWAVLVVWWAQNLRENTLSPDNSLEDFALKGSRKMERDPKGSVGPMEGLLHMAGYISRLVEIAQLMMHHCWCTGEGRVAGLWGVHTWRLCWEPDSHLQGWEGSRMCPGVKYSGTERKARETTWATRISASLSCFFPCFCHLGISVSLIFTFLTLPPT